MAHNYEKVKKYIESFEGYTLLSEEYKNHITKLLIKCPKGHEFMMSYNQFQSGQRCSVCANITRGNKLRNNYENVKKYIESFEGYTLLSEEYVNNTSKLKILCPKGHEFMKSYNSFQSGQRCTVCFNLNRGKSRLFSYEYVKKYIESEGYKLLSEKYQKSSVKLKIQCPEGHEYMVKFNSFRQGCRCPMCANTYPLKYEDVKRYIEEKGFILLSEKYVNSKTKLSIKCPNGHIFERRFKEFRNYETCTKCNISLGESKIMEFLTNENIKFKYQKRYKELNPRYSFDFYLPKYNLIIEFDGRQHFEPVNFSGCQDKEILIREFERSKQRDNEKNE